MVNVGCLKACGVYLLFVAVAVPVTYAYQIPENGIHLAERGGINSFSRDKRALPSKGKPQVTGETCTGYDGQKGRCLQLENCVLQALKENYIKYKAYYCITPQSTVGVCCPSTVAIPDVYDERTFSSQGTSGGRRRSSRSIQQKSHHRRLSRSIADEANSCGRNGRLLSQVSNNRAIENKAWPWAVSIINADTQEHHCGATLISRYHILSAAHCFYYGGAYVLKDRVRARLGEYDFLKKDDAGSNDYEIANIIVHEDYDEPTHENDVAIIVLARPARYNIYVQPACMPTPGEEYDNRTAVVVGWGMIEFAGPSSSVLREVTVPVWEHASCANNYLQTIFTTNVCAASYEGGKDSCQGDSGGPLVVQRQDGRWEIIGIVSWGVQCGLKGKPGIYAQVNKYYDWFNERLN
ncbi:venom protease-like [Lycorma delicatula]|uniref:venom protease-like n=1 Tax=Lycorma delicatula TaxID=130591 RepID=UPI003F50D809